MGIIKGFMGTLIGVTLGGEAIRQVGGITQLGPGIKSTTQTFIGLGVIANAARNTKDIFKFK